MGVTWIFSSRLDSSPLADVVDESRRLVVAAGERGVVARLIGGVAVQLQSPPGGPLLPRSINDIDLVTKRGVRSAITGVLVDAGYVPNEMFNALHGTRRLLFNDETNHRKLDVFVGEFAMCHPVPIAERLERETLTVPLAELLITKLQVVELTERDQRDIYSLVHAHSVSLNDDPGIEGGLIAILCARDWGLWRTCKATIETCLANLGNYSLPVDAARVVRQRLELLWKCIDAAPKSARWRLRSRVGDRVRWYEQPEENAAEN